SKEGADVKKGSKRKEVDVGDDDNVILYKRRKRTDREKSLFLPSPEAAITATRTTTAATTTGTPTATTATTTAETATRTPIVMIARIPARTITRILAKVTEGTIA